MVLLGDAEVPLSREWDADGTDGCNRRADASSAGPQPEQCRPFTEEELGGDEVAAGGWYNQVAFRHMQEVNVPILDAYRITLPMWQLHMKERGDCVRYCSPGAYDTWTYLLTQLIKGLELRPVESAMVGPE